MRVLRKNGCGQETRTPFGLSLSKAYPSMLCRRLASDLARDYKSVHREVAMLTAIGLVERRARSEVALKWDRA